MNLAIPPGTTPLGQPVNVPEQGVKRSSGSQPLLMSPRQTQALLPQELSPVGQGPEIQEVAGKEQEPSRLAEEAQKLAERANTYLRMADTHLEFSVGKETGRIIISVVDSETQKVVRSIPPESLVRFLDRIDQMRGLLFNAKG
jgi:flagellar protein FlaG